MNPKVSICLPNLNTRPFLERRFQSIFDQSLSDWELIVFDAYSDDGSWELIQQYAEQEQRMRAFQAPRQGHMFVDLNTCINLSQGEYIYIATSDDTMMPDCIEKMVSGLDKHQDCDLCHCCLRVIDKHGNDIENWWENFSAQRFYGELTYKPHIRKAPMDGILHFAFCTVYTSLTQLLIRKKAFAKVGLFRTDWGPIGDFEWGMRASLVSDTLHIPEYLASWRIHEDQATSEVNTPDNRRKLMEMAKEALKILVNENPSIYRRLNHDILDLLAIYRQETDLLNLFKYNDGPKRLPIPHRLTTILSHPLAYLKLRQLEIKKIQFIRHYLNSLRLYDNISFLPDKEISVPPNHYTDTT